MLADEASMHLAQAIAGMGRAMRAYIAAAKRNNMRSIRIPRAEAEKFAGILERAAQTADDIGIAADRGKDL